MIKGGTKTESKEWKGELPYEQRGEFPCILLSTLGESLWEILLTGIKLNLNLTVFTQEIIYWKLHKMRHM